MLYCIEKTWGELLLVIISQHDEAHDWENHAEYWTPAAHSSGNWFWFNLYLSTVSKFAQFVCRRTITLTDQSTLVSAYVTKWVVCVLRGSDVEKTEHKQIVFAGREQIVYVDIRQAWEKFPVLEEAE